ncbi:PGF-CTERM sorting domain-containing protein [Natronorubrum sp. FCH18a]|uniref:PGF-CTERM sorting domain-containing protein n=1 Tax=Natronorubrum sp. FCH18a TaxID=3447018 RepID=UPI003F50FA83
MISVTDRTTVSIGLTAVVVVGMILGGIAMPVAAQEDVGSQSMEVTVAEDGSVELMEVTWRMDGATYEEFEMYAEAEGYEQVDDWFESMYETEEWIGEVSVTTTEIDGGYALSIELVDIDTDDVPEVDIDVEGDTIRYEEFDVSDPAEDPVISESTHRVNMPGEITDSNADEVDGTVAVWNHHEEHTDEFTTDLFVEASLEAKEDTEADNESADDENDSDDGDESSSADDSDDGDGMPGFGGAVAIVALCLATVLSVSRRMDAR